MSHIFSRKVYAVLTAGVFTAVMLFFALPAQAQSDEISKESLSDARKAEIQLCHFVPKINDYRRVLLSEYKAAVHLDSHSKDELSESGEDCPEVTRKIELTSIERKRIQRELNKVLQQAQEILRKVNNL